ncbi:MAG: hypothetical protein AB7P76_08180 [Candidatus Melainabacteria bacterium]
MNTVRPAQPNFGRAFTLPDSTGLTLRTLGLTTPIGYTVRGLYRTTEVTDDRRLDYWWRDLYITDAMFLCNELAFRLTNKLMDFPQFQRYLELDQLAGVPGMVTRKGKSRFPEALRTRVATSLVRPGSLYLVPDIVEKNLDLAPEGVDALRNHLIPRLSPEQNIRETVMRANGFRPGRYMEMGADEKLLTDLIHEMDHQDRNYLETLRKDYRLFDHPRKEALLKAVDEDRLAKTLMNTLAGKKGPGGAELPESLVETVSRKLRHAKASEAVGQKRVLTDWLDNNTVFQHLEALGQSHVLDEVRALPYADDLLRAIKEGIHSKAVSTVLEKVSKKRYWPQLLFTFIAGYLVQGTLMNAVDYKFLQPLEKKLYKKYGTTKPIIPASLWSLIPGGGVFLALLQTRKPLPLTRKLGYLTRPALAGALGLLVYGLSTAFLMFKGLEKMYPQRGQAKNDGSTPLPLPLQPEKNTPEKPAPLSMIRSFEEPGLFQPAGKTPQGLRHPNHFSVFQQPAES